MATLAFEHTEEELELENNSDIQEACEDQGVPFACTEGVCGTCVIMVKEGSHNLSPKTQEELDFLGDDGPQEGDEFEEERLACQCKIMQNSVTLSF